MRFFHSRGIMYIVAYDKDHKLTGLPRSSDRPVEAILSEYDFNVAHFFPLGISWQRQELNNCIMTAIEKLKPFSE